MLDNNSDSRLWVLEILTGKVPAKTTQYHDGDRIIRKEIIDLFLKIEKVRFVSKYKPSKLIEVLSSRQDMVDLIHKTLLTTHSISKKKIRIIYTNNVRPRYVVKVSNNFQRIYVLIPIIDDDNW